MQRSLRGPRVLGLVLATVGSTTVAHWAVGGHVSAGAVAVLTVLSIGPLAWLGSRRRPLPLVAPLLALVQLAWHVGLAAATPAGPAGAVTVGHHAHLEQALADGSASWADLLPDTAGWAMVAAHTVAALALLLAVTAAESVVTGLGTLLRRGLDAALAVLAAAAAHRPLPRPVACLTPDRWLPAAPVGAVVARRPLRRGPPRPLGA